ncbi:hypothetical protein JTB14_005095 [Gonioctena quinquepunctata]|nr:hypothetical protein JTB14_005095 [Gonioctena quinquepunctata]
MELSQTVNLYVTCVEKEGPFLKLWGQTEKNNAIYVEQFLTGIAHQFEVGVGKVPPESLQCGTLVCAKYKDNKYYRARIINIFVRDSFVEVIFIDFGNKDILSCGNIRSMQNCPSSFISIPPLAVGFIFAEAHCVGGGEWNETIYESIAKEIKYREVQCHLLTQATQYYLVKLYLEGTDLCSLLIQRGLMQPISLQAQQAVLLSMSIQRQNIQTPTPSQITPAINTYKAVTLEPGCQYPVYVSYVNDGPCHFSVQLKQSEDILAKLMKDINSITLRLLEDVPIPGTICLARCQEDGNICRAVVTNEVDNQFKVFYVDFGNYEIVSLDSVFQIPFKYVIPKVMAIRFALAGVEKATVTIEMQVVFKKFVDNRMLHMKVLPAPTRMAVPKCELWDPESKTSALDVVNRAALHSYPEPISLNRGFSQPVKVSFVYSCSRFYVQLISKENELTNLMLELQEICQTNGLLEPSGIKTDLPCCALFLADSQWYRSQVMEVLGETVKVRYIDYGNEEEVLITHLKSIDGEQLTVLRPQAIECCLNGYQNMGEDAERDGFLEEIILEQTFTMKVVEMLGKKALVELFDGSMYNVASLLLDKMAAAKSQASPMLVQAGNKIEHRKSYSQQKEGQTHRDGYMQRDGNRDNFRSDRDNRTERDNSNWNNKPTDRSEKPWRQDNRENRPNNQRNNRQRSQEGDSWNTENTANNNSDWNTTQTSPIAVNNGCETTNSNTLTNDDWNNDRARQERGPKDYGRNKKGFDDNRGDYSGKQREGEYRKKPDYRKDGTEHSSSGSEKSFHKGPRTSSRNDRGGRGGKFERNFEKPRGGSYNNTNSLTDDSWNVSAVVPSIDAAPVSTSFIPYDVVGSEAKVTISWFHHPCHFYCKIFDNQDQFKTMMEEIQEFYKSRKPEMSVVGAPIIGLFPEDNVLYRARVLELVGRQYKVFYVDFGNVSTIDKVWPIDKKFMNLPAQATVCSLNCIAPVGDDWSDPDSYSRYFEKDTFTCNFINKDEEKTYVNIVYESEDIAQLLIRDGLAVSTQAFIPDIEIPLLLGQQFRAVLKSVNSLSDIIIALECGVAISCSMHNLEFATEIFEDNLRGLLEQTVIVYVDNVIDNRIEVTFYDIEGNKHIILDPDEGSFETVECPCPMLVLCSTITGYVPYAEKTNIYIQPTEYSETVAYLLNQLFEAYNDKPQDSTIIPEEGMLYAVHSEDGNWYRARVISFNDEKATVCYVDYGNYEDVAFSELRELNQLFLDIPLLCLPVITTAESEPFIDKDVTAIIFYGENGWEGTVDILESSATESTKMDETVDTGFATSSLDKPEVITDYVESSSQMGDDLEAEDVPSIDNVNDLEAEDEPTSSHVNEALADVETDIPTLKDEETQQLPKNDFVQVGTPVYTSHVDSPNEFYLQFLEALSEIEELQAKIQTEVSEWSVLESPSAGIICAAPYSGDQQWYRAEILDADDDITTVRFIDFGNTDVIDNKTTEIKTLPHKLLSLAIYATKCSLKIKPIDEEWSATTLEVFEGLAMADNITAEFLDQNEKTNYVELYSDGVNICEGLIRENLAVGLMQTVETKSTGFVSHLNSPTEFWIQLENCIDELEWIAEQLSSAENFSELEDLTPGTLCAALFPDDQMWYRARILSNTVAGIELLFIDYGNSCTSSSLRQLPEDLLVTAPLAQKCSLQKPEGIPTWSPEAAAKFGEISADGQTIFTIKKISTGETSVVQLFIDGEDVTTLLLPVTEDGYVKVKESLEKLEIEKADGEDVGCFQLEPMDGQELNEEAKQNFEQINMQGSTLFQIEFVNDNTVRLYLNDSDIRPQLGGFKNNSFESPDEENSQKDGLSRVKEQTEKDSTVDGAEQIGEEGEIIASHYIVVDTTKSEIPKEFSSDKNDVIEENGSPEIRYSLDEYLSDFTPLSSKPGENPVVEENTTVSVINYPESHHQDDFIPSTLENQVVADKIHRETGYQPELSPKEDDVIVEGEKSSLVELQHIDDFTPSSLHLENDPLIVNTIDGESEFQQKLSSEKDDVIEGGGNSPALEFHEVDDLISSSLNEDENQEVHTNEAETESQIELFPEKADVIEYEDKFPIIGDNLKSLNLDESIPSALIPEENPIVDTITVETGVPKKLSPDKEYVTENEDKPQIMTDNEESQHVGNSVSPFSNLEEKDNTFLNDTIEIKIVSQHLGDIISSSLSQEENKLEVNRIEGDTEAQKGLSSEKADETDNIGSKHQLDLVSSSTNLEEKENTVLVDTIGREIESQQKFISEKDGVIEDEKKTALECHHLSDFISSSLNQEGNQLNVNEIEEDPESRKELSSGNAVVIDNLESKHPDDLVSSSSSLEGKQNTVIFETIEAQQKFPSEKGDVIEEDKSPAIESHHPVDLIDSSSNQEGNQFKVDDIIETESEKELYSENIECQHPVDLVSPSNIETPVVVEKIEKEIESHQSCSSEKEIHEAFQDSTQTLNESDYNPPKSSEACTLSDKLSEISISNEKIVLDITETPDDSGHESCSTSPEKTLRESEFKPLNVDVSPKKVIADILDSIVDSAVSLIDRTIVSQELQNESMQDRLGSPEGNRESCSTSQENIVLGELPVVAQQGLDSQDINQDPVLNNYDKEIDITTHISEILYKTLEFSQCEDSASIEKQQASPERISVHIDSKEISSTNDNRSMTCSKSLENDKVESITSKGESQTDSSMQNIVQSLECQELESSVSPKKLQESPKRLSPCKDAKITPKKVSSTKDVTVSSPKSTVRTSLYVANMLASKKDDASPSITTSNPPKRETTPQKVIVVSKTSPKKILSVKMDSKSSPEKSPVKAIAPDSIKKSKAVKNAAPRQPHHPRL